VITAQIALAKDRANYRAAPQQGYRSIRIRRLRSISICPAHDLPLEGIDLMLKKRGRPSVAALTKKE
jgi:glyoxylase-like metal-dependent hydrolase (beta-lactamase superfamily II)